MARACDLCMLVVAGNASVRSAALARMISRSPGPAFRDHIDRDDEAAAQGTTQPVVVTASVTDSFDTKLNQRLKNNETRWRLTEIRRPWRPIRSRSRRSQKLADQVEQPKRPRKKKTAEDLGEGVQVQLRFKLGYATPPCRVRRIVTGKCDGKLGDGGLPLAAAQAASGPRSMGHRRAVARQA